MLLGENWRRCDRIHLKDDEGRADWRALSFVFSIENTDIQDPRIANLKKQGIYRTMILQLP